MVTVPILWSGSLKTADWSTSSTIANCRFCWLLASQTSTSNKTILWDIKASFEKCWECIAKLLWEHPGHLHFMTNAITSPNHHAFIAWMVHLEYKGSILSFLLDIIKLPEISFKQNTNISQSHTGVAMAKAFQHMLEQYGLTQKIHTVNSDNTTPNDRQTTKLATLDNSFEEANHVQYFNHTATLPKGPPYTIQHS